MNPPVVREGLLKGVSRVHFLTGEELEMLVPELGCPVLDPVRGLGLARDVVHRQAAEVQAQPDDHLDAPTLAVRETQH